MACAYGGVVSPVVVGLGHTPAATRLVASPVARAVTYSAGPAIVASAPV